MIRLTPLEILALGAARNHAPGISTRDGVLDEERWAEMGNGPLPTAEEIAQAFAAHAPAKSDRERIADLEDAMRQRP